MLIRLGGTMRRPPLREDAGRLSDKDQCLGRARLGQGRTRRGDPNSCRQSEPCYLGYGYGNAGRRKEAEKLAASFATLSNKL